ncbi:MAG: hypothetical protein OXO50_17015 [Caldilineaceae bacterium]|nr:hypothetical protein [Caldilineaceae bacterium]
MTKSRQNNESVHEQAVSILERHILENLDATLNATGWCNECRDELNINLVEGASRVERNKQVGPVRPDLSIFDSLDRALRFVEIVDSHKPESNVHNYAMRNGIEVIEFHLNAKKEFVGKRKNRALDASLTTKTRLEDLKAKRLEIDSHTLLCQRPKCDDCSHPLPKRTISISEIDCWKCKRNLRVAVGYKDDEALGYHITRGTEIGFTDEELEFIKANGVVMERRFSSDAGTKYLANICPHCDRLTGNWFLYSDPHHRRFNVHLTTREKYGPCDRCSTLWCNTHGDYLNFADDPNCPECVREAEKSICSNVSDRECFYPDRCQRDGCYFQNRHEQELKRQTQEKQETAERQRKEAEVQKRKAIKRKLDQEAQAVERREFIEWFERRRIDK